MARRPLHLAQLRSNRQRVSPPLGRVLQRADGAYNAAHLRSSIRARIEAPLASNARILLPTDLDLYFTHSRCQSVFEHGARSAPQFCPTALDQFLDRIRTVQLPLFAQWKSARPVQEVTNQTESSLRNCMMTSFSL